MLKNDLEFRLGREIVKIDIESLLQLSNFSNLSFPPKYSLNTINVATFFKTHVGRLYLVDYALEQVEEMIDPVVFFRINRRYLIAFQSISDIITYSNSRLKVVVPHMEEADILVSRQRVSEFKKWLDR